MRIANWLLWAAVSFASFTAFAQVTTVAYYRLGEADPGATVAAPGANPTINSAGGVNLPRIGTPVYSASVPPGGLSQISMSFNGTTDAYLVGAPLSVVTDNFGIEAWVLSTTTLANAALAYNGNGASSGWGLYRIGATYQFLYGGVVQGGAAPVTIGTWTHLAVVRNAGVTTFYVNGAVNAVSGAAPNVPAGGFGIAIDPVINNEFHAGLVDEVRVFTFAPGTFVAGNLLFFQVRPSTVPTLNEFAQIALALALAVVALMRLRRAAFTGFRRR